MGRNFGIAVLDRHYLNPESITRDGLSYPAINIRWFVHHRLKVAVNVSSSGKPVLRYMYYVNEPGLTLLMKKTP